MSAYPPDQQWDICRDAPTAAAIKSMGHLPFPNSDPVTGPLLDLWKTKPAR